jgi:HNH endonuclease
MHERRTQPVLMAGKVTIDPIERFFQKIEIADSCWLWRGVIQPNGYGTFSVRYRYMRAHRFAYELFNGPIAVGLEIDHLCKTRNCVNPEHLEAVTKKENILRSNCFAAINARKTECTQGHPYDELNTYIDSLGKRHCRRCHSTRESQRQWALRRQ